MFSNLDLSHMMSHKLIILHEKNVQPKGNIEKFFKIKKFYNFFVIALGYDFLK